MKVINRLVSLVICFVVAAAMCPVVCARETNAEDYSYEMSVLKALGFLEQDVSPDNTVTRADMAKMVAKLYPANGIDYAAKKYFIDVDAKSDYCNDINFLADLGVITKTDDMLFHPQREIEPNHAVKMIVSAMGLDYLAAGKGGYPIGYNYVAASKNIVSNIGFYDDNTLCFGKAAKAIYNVLMSDVNYTNSYDGIYDTDFERFMSKRLGIYYADGIFTGNSVTSISAVNVIKNRVTVDGIMYYDGEKYENLIGEKVCVFYGLKGNNRHILYMCVNNSKDSIVLNYDDIKDYKSGVYEYYKDFSDNTKRAVLSNDFEVIYNNKTIVDGEFFNASMMIPVVGEVKLIDNNEDGKYDVAVIWNYSKFCVDSFNAYDGIVYGAETDKDGEKNSKIEIRKKGDDCGIYFDDGTYAEVSDVMIPDTLLDVAVSADGEYCTIIICKKMLRGTVNSISGEHIVIDDKEYILSPYFSDDIKSGSSYDFYFNHIGTISYCKTFEDDEYRFGFVIDAGAICPEISRNLYLKVYSDENLTVTQKFAKKVLVNDIGKVTSKQVISLLTDSDGNPKRQIIKYKLNKDGEFKEIRTFTPEQVIIDEKPVRHYGLTRLFDNKYPVDKDAKVFLVGNPVNEDNISVRTASFFGTYSSPERVTTGYASDSTRPDVIDVVVLTYDKSYVDYDVDTTPPIDATVGGKGVLVEKVTRVLVGKDEMYKLVAWYGRKKIDVIVEDENALKFDADKGQYIEGGANTETVGAGDYIKYGLNEKERITRGNLIVVYDCDRDNYRKDGTGASYSYATKNLTSGHSISRIFGYNNVESWYMFSDKKPYVVSTEPYEDNITSDDYVTVSLSQSADVIVFDKKTKKTRAGTVNDILTFKQSGSECVNGIMYCYQANPSTIKIYLYE